MFGLHSERRAALSVRTESLPECLSFARFSGASIVTRRGPHLLAGDFQHSRRRARSLDARKLPARLRPFVWLSGGRIRWRTIQLS